VNILRFRVATHILKVNFAEMAKDRPGQPAYEFCFVNAVHYKFVQ